MARPARTELIACRYYRWRLFLRDGVYYADGRMNRPPLGKSSLNTRDREEALRRLQDLDLHQAVSQGQAKPAPAGAGRPITISDGWLLFFEHANRPDVAGGTAASTRKRYRAVRDKHISYCVKTGVETWNDVDVHHVEDYGKMLHRKGYAPRSLYLEMTTLKSLHKFLIQRKKLPEENRFHLPLRRPQGSDTYCYTADQVMAMIQHCQTTRGLQWLAEIIEILALTGMRISELAQLTWRDISMDAEGQAAFLMVADERGNSRRSSGQDIRTTKGRRSRRIPIHPRLAGLLVRLTRHVDGRLVHGPRGGRLKPDTVRNVFIREVLTPLSERFPETTSQRGFRDGRLHSFRHFFVSQAFREGASESEIKDWVGHRDSRVVEFYRHVGDEDSRRRMQRLTFIDSSTLPDGPHVSSRFHQEPNPPEGEERHGIGGTDAEST